MIGGSAVYGETLTVADRVYATEIDAEIEGDAFFPELSRTEWRCSQRGEPIIESELSFNFAVYERNA